MEREGERNIGGKKRQRTATCILVSLYSLLHFFLLVARSAPQAYALAVTGLRLGRRRKLKSAASGEQCRARSIIFSSEQSGVRWKFLPAGYLNRRVIRNHLTRRWVSAHSGIVWLTNLRHKNFFHGIRYEPCSPKNCEWAIENAGIDPKEFSFIDMGCGAARSSSLRGISLPS